ncbi:MAG: hypothetical protein ABSE62_13805, partial [Chthoniobacteraceae bacterium]
APGSPRLLLLRYVDLHFDFISARHRHAPLFQQFISRAASSRERLVRKYIVPRAGALRLLLLRGMKQREFRKSDPFHTAVSLAALIVFYFSSAPMLKLIGHSNPYAKASLARRKREVRDFIRHGLFIDPQVSPK